MPGLAEVVSISQAKTNLSQLVKRASTDGPSRFCHRSRALLNSGCEMLTARWPQPPTNSTRYSP